MGDVGGQIVNADFHTDIDDIVQMLNNIDPDLTFDRNHIVEDVLLNPGPSDENVENILEEVLNFQDVALTGEDMDESESEDELPAHQDPMLPAHQDPIRPNIYSALKDLTKLRNVPLTKSMLPHRLDEWKKHIKFLENIAMDCFTKKQNSATSKKANVPATRSTAAIPSTSAVEKPSDIVNSTTTTTASTLMNESTDNHSDVISNTSQEEAVHINTIQDYESVYTDLLGPTASIYDSDLNAEIIHEDTEEDSLPALHEVKELKEDLELMEVTVFRPLHDNNNKKSKFDRYTEQSSFESQESFD